MYADVLVCVLVCACVQVLLCECVLVQVFVCVCWCERANVWLSLLLCRQRVRAGVQLYWCVLMCWCACWFAGVFVRVC